MKIVPINYDWSSTTTANSPVTNWNVSSTTTANSPVTNWNVSSTTTGNSPVTNWWNNNVIFTNVASTITDNGTSTNIIFVNDVVVPTSTIIDDVIFTKADLKRRRLRDQYRSRPISRQYRPNFNRVEENELVALRLLKGLVGAKRFRRYLRDGLITAYGPSGLRYEIRRDAPARGGITVWRDQPKPTPLAGICVHWRGVPKSDECATKVLMAENDEAALWNCANLWFSGTAMAIARSSGAFETQEAGVIDRPMFPGVPRQRITDDHLLALAHAPIPLVDVALKSIGPGFDAKVPSLRAAA